MATPTKMEFAVNMTCMSCKSAIENALKNKPEIKSVSVNLGDQQVVVETTLTTSEVKNLLESTGRRANLKGHGSAEPTTSVKHLGAAVSMLQGPSCVEGVVRFLQATENTCIIEGTLDNLKPGPHGLNIHEFGDLSNGCESCGPHYNPYNSRHGAPGENERHVGDLGNIVADENGRATFRFEDDKMKVWDIIGRSVVVHDAEDDLGRGLAAESKLHGNSGIGLSCGIVARSAGLFQNPKKFCQCDGVVIWDERDVPLTGPRRQQQSLL
ncbi:copper chaperone for superoxide dismutase-like [Anneissia japonica]|uniref:copper chaperone for superoxide dismutase-like n=1 Tax=Anneissia japonica TaxID=1529436 RepID=UPI0014255E45|nr:copper chaperone for superoxide dismutase-like [Anneissia japonica]